MEADMSFLTVNGLPVQVRVSSVSAQETYMDSVARSQNDSLQGTVFSIKATRTFLTEPLPRFDARALRGWLRNEGEQWSFGITRKLGTTTSTRIFTNVGDAGMAAFSVNTPGTISNGSISGVPNLSIYAASTASVFTQIPFPVTGDGWTVSFFQASAATPGFISHSVIRRDGAGVVAAWHQGASVATVRSFSHSIVNGNFQLTLIGRCATVATNSNTNFSFVKFMPFAISEDMVPALSAGVGAQPPFAACKGDFLDTDTEVDYRATTTAADFSPLVVDEYEYDARQLTVNMVQR